MLSLLSVYAGRYALPAQERLAVAYRNSSEKRLTGGLCRYKVISNDNVL